jgi:FtsH-binding integral membrane protein
MALGLAATGAVAYYASTSMAVRRVLFGNGFVPLIVLSVAEIGIVFFLSAKALTLNPTTASALFFVYSVLNGFTIAPIFLLYTGESISTAFFSSAAVFGSMSVYGTVTKRDLSSWGSFLSMGLWGIIIALAINMFVGNLKADLVISIMAVIVFTGLAAYDTFKLRKIAAEGGFGEDKRDSVAVLGALILYLDFINMFLHLLRLMGKRR